MTKYKSNTFTKQRSSGRLTDAQLALTRGGYGEELVGRRDFVSLDSGDHATASEAKTLT